ncbi:MAG: hypothetical protein H0U95_10000 [Bacteroidetes bacterium]|nr:hypothetical protein [Bacteroidota bacterium]
MKLSTLALGALVSLSVTALAQEKPKTVTKVKHTKTIKTKCVNSKNQLAVRDSTLLVEPKYSPKVCEACGRG